MMNLLFVCSKNQWRSPTAEAIYRNVEGIDARSAGTEQSARVRVSEKLLDWADVIFVMEHHHKKRLVQDHRHTLQGKELIVLDIPDEYPYMDEELISMIRVAVDSYLSE